MKMQIFYAMGLTMTVAMSFNFGSETETKVLAPGLLSPTRIPWTGPQMNGQRNDIGTYKKETEELYSAINTWISGFLFRLKIVLEDQEKVGHNLEILDGYFRSELASIYGLLKNKEVPPKINYQLRFAKFIYRAIYDSSYFLTFLSLRETEQDMVARIGQQSIKLLALHDQFGYPDPQAPGYIDEIASNENFFKHWKTLVEKEAGLPESLHTMIQSQLQDAFYILNFLESSIKHESKEKAPELISPSIILEIEYE